MNDYLILIGLPLNLTLGDGAEEHLNKRRWAISELVFSFGPAWHGPQSAILLKSSLTRDEIVERVSALLESDDFVGVLEISTRSVVTLGWNPDQEGFDRLFPDVVKFGVSAFHPNLR
jgi:hypothetical protein